MPHDDDEAGFGKKGLEEAGADEVRRGLLHQELPVVGPIGEPSLEDAKGILR